MVIFIIGSKGNKFFNLVKRLIMGISRIIEKTLLRDFIPCLLIQLLIHHLIVSPKVFLLQQPYSSCKKNSLSHSECEGLCVQFPCMRVKIHFGLPFQNDITTWKNLSRDLGFLICKSEISVVRTSCLLQLRLFLHVVRNLFLMKKAIREVSRLNIPSRLSGINFLI